MVMDFYWLYVIDPKNDPDNNMRRAKQIVEEMFKYAQDNFVLVNVYFKVVKYNGLFINASNPLIHF